MTVLNRSLPIGSRVQVIGFSNENLYRERIHEMGIRVGTELKIMAHMPFGGPILVKFQTTFLALRQLEAACAQVKILP